MDLNNTFFKPLQAGHYRNRIQIQKLNIIQGNMGGVVKDWSAFATVWAAVEPLWGRELFSAQKLSAESQVRIRIRHLAGVEPKMRVQHKNKHYDILVVLPVQERNIETHLLCREVI